jgi:hypothetical protein
VYEKPKRTKDDEALQYVREKPCAVCSRNPPSDPHHITTRGAGGGDTKENLVALCREHHNEIHNIGQTRFLVRYPHLRLKSGQG